MSNGVTALENQSQEYQEGYIQAMRDTTTERKELTKVRKSIMEMKDSQTYFQKKIIDLYGHFFFSFYKRLNMKERQYLFRFMYLCTYMNYDNYLSDGTRLIKEEKLGELLKLKQTEVFKTKKYLIENEFIAINEKGNVLVNERYCKKGNIQCINTEFTRVFNNGLQEIYLQSLPKEHRKLSLLIEILPYINFRFNILCKNTTEEYLEHIEPLKMTELCEILGYHKTNSSKLKKDLFNLTVKGEQVIGMWEKSCGKAIFVNPRVYYKGTREEDVNFLYVMFEAPTV